MDAVVENDYMTSHIPSKYSEFVERRVNHLNHERRCIVEMNIIARLFDETSFSYSGHWELELSSKLRVGDKTSHDKGFVIDAFGLKFSGT